MTNLIKINRLDCNINGITKGANAIVTSPLHGQFMISKTNFNKLINNSELELVGAIVEVPNFTIKMFKTLKF